ncbi:hypothetical protein [Christiangramia sediminis]|uniref:Uncharacterized protein n=1 Tax=Christiangramia sediminis TaxID=2881336 RepID=A0A9X1RWT8_9FLAO|nr:hypothetical protein [Christiangramia sediminis]MCB7480559.1 hypothetical protein [Christiangramia sediminis]
MHCQDKHLQVIEHLKTKYDFTLKEQEILENIKKYSINSIAFTTDGGFDVKTGEFYPEERKENYKIRIIYEDELSKKVSFICLKPIYVNDNAVS